jgi:hypothetical protein
MYHALGRLHKAALFFLEKRNYRMIFTLVIIHATIASLDSRFEYLKTFEKLFCFLLSQKKINDQWTNCVTFVHVFLHKLHCMQD